MNGQTRAVQINLRDSKGRTALQFAAMQNRGNCAELLLEAGADPDIAADDCDLPLCVAAQEGDRAKFSCQLQELLSESGKLGRGVGGVVGFNSLARIFIYFLES